MHSANLTPGGLLEDHLCFCFFLHTPHAAHFMVFSCQPVPTPAPTPPCVDVPGRQWAQQKKELLCIVIKLLFCICSLFAVCFQSPCPLYLCQAFSRWAADNSWSLLFLLQLSFTEFETQTTRVICSRIGHADTDAFVRIWLLAALNWWCLFTGKKPF